MGRHLQLLECSTDGRISDRARDLARALDNMERALMPPPARVEVGAVSLKPEAVIRRMARVIAACGTARGHVHVKDFERAGLTQAQAERHFAAAFQRARIMEPALDALDAS